MISVLLHFEDVFGRGNQGGHCGGGRMWGDRRRLGYTVCVRKVYWKGCGNAATARGGLDTAWSHSSVIWNSNHFIERVGRRSQLNSWGCQKRTSGRPTADLHLANPSSCFFDAAWCVIFLLANFIQTQRFVIRQILTDSELTIHDSSIWVLSEFPLGSSFKRDFSSALRQLPRDPWGPYWVTGFWILRLFGKWRLAFTHRKSPIRSFDPSWLACNPWPLVLEEKRAHRDSQFC